MVPFLIELVTNDTIGNRKLSKVISFKPIKREAEREAKKKQTKNAHSEPSV